MKLKIEKRWLKDGYEWLMCCPSCGRWFPVDIREVKGIETSAQCPKCEKRWGIFRIV